MVELSLHGLYHQVNGQLDDFDTQTKEEEKKEIQKGLDILSSTNLPRPSIFIPPAKRQKISTPFCYELRSSWR
jgi:predicted deacetylase